MECGGRICQFKRLSKQVASVHHLGNVPVLAAQEGLFLAVCLHHLTHQPSAGSLGQQTYS